MASDHLGMGVPKIPQRLESLEIWKKRGGFLISSLGNIKTRGGRSIKQHTNKRGYKFIAWGKSSKFVHTLVATAFIGSRNGQKLDVHHIDLSKDHNYINNLEYLTHKEHCGLHKIIRKRNRG